MNRKASTLNTNAFDLPFSQYENYRKISILDEIEYLVTRKGRGHRFAEYNRFNEAIQSLHVLPLEPESSDSIQKTLESGLTLIVSNLNRLSESCKKCVIDHLFSFINHNQYQNIDEVLAAAIKSGVTELTYQNANETVDLLSFLLIKKPTSKPIIIKKLIESGYSRPAGLTIEEAMTEAYRSGTAAAGWFLSACYSDGFTASDSSVALNNPLWFTPIEKYSASSEDKQTYLKEYFRVVDTSILEFYDSTYPISTFRCLWDDLLKGIDMSDYETYLTDIASSSGPLWDYLNELAKDSDFVSRLRNETDQITVVDVLLDKDIMARVEDSKQKNEEEFQGRVVELLKPLRILS